MEIDWNDYTVYTTPDGERYVEHDVRGCYDDSDAGLYFLQDFIDWSLNHHEICSLKD